MNLSELKQKSVPELMEIANAMGLDNAARARKQEIIFNILSFRVYCLLVTCIRLILILN